MTSVLKPKRAARASGSAVAPALTNQLSAIEQRLGPIAYLPLDTLKRYEGNPRKHPEKQLVKLEASIRNFGFTIPVLLDSDNIIIAGEARVEAARRAGMREVPVLVADQWSQAQVRAYRLIDNRLAEHAQWDRELLAIEFAAIIDMGEVSVDLLGWEIGEIDVLLEAQADNAGSGDAADVVPPLPVVPVSRTGDIWILGKHRLICGSSLDSEVWKKLMDGASAAMAFTDPPYNVPIAGHVSGLGQARHDAFAMASGEMSRAEFTDFLGGFLEAMCAHLADGAMVDICMDWRHLYELQVAVEKAGLSVLNLCVWNKANGGMGSLYRSKYELVLICKKGTGPHVNNVELGKHGRYRTNVWDYAGVNSFSSTRMQDLADHPTVKPIALVADAIRDVTQPGTIVTDAFMGSGTTILAAERAGRIAYGVEIAPGYVDVALRRWEAMTGREALLAATGQSLREVAAVRLSETDEAHVNTAAAA